MANRDGTKCPVCDDGTLRAGVSPVVMEYRGEEFTAKRTGVFCDHCGDGFADNEEAIEQQWEAFRSAIDRDQSAELAAIRARLGLTQEEASKISGGGHNAFSRYERMEAQPVMGVINLFRLLAQYPGMLVHFLHDRTTILATTSTSTARIGDEQPHAVVARVSALSAPLPYIVLDASLATSIDIDEILPIVPTMAHVPRQPAPQVRTLKIPHAQRKRVLA